jgi:acyl-CoA-binding protein
VCSWKAWVGLEGLAEEEIEGKIVAGVENDGNFEFGTV